MGSERILEQVLKEYYTFNKLDVIGIIEYEVETIKSRYINSDLEEKKVIRTNLDDEISSYKDQNAKLYMLSVLLELTMDGNYFDEMISLVHTVGRDFWSWKTKYQLYEQLARKMFKYSFLYCSERAEKLAELYRIIIEDMKATLNLPLQEIPLSERDSNFVIVLTNQFLVINHGPTKTAMDRCNTLMRCLGKQVILINTAEVLSLLQKLPLHTMDGANYNKPLLEYSYIEYQGLDIPYVQCEKIMPNEEIMLFLLDFIMEKRPQYILNIGGHSPFTELCDMIVPTICIGLSPSAIEHHCGRLQVVGKKLEQEDDLIIKALGKSREDYIEGCFTSSIPMEKISISKRDLGVEEDDFVCALVGGRLNSEITREFVEVMTSTTSSKVKFITMGHFDKGYKTYAEEIEGFSDKWIDLGLIDNVMGVFEQCDLYINPKRRGGGTSVIEAMSEGVPAVTIRYGDVYTNAGEEFAVENYSEMSLLIEKYHTDEDFYHEMSLKAKERADFMLDTDKQMCLFMEAAERKLGIR